MLQIRADIEVSEFPVVLVGVYAVGQKDEDYFVFWVGPGKCAREARVAKRCLGCQYIAGATSTCSWPIKTGGAAVAWVLLFGEFVVGGLREEALARHVAFVQEKLHDVRKTPGVRKDTGMTCHAAQHSRAWVVYIATQQLLAVSLVVFGRDDLSI